MPITILSPYSGKPVKVRDQDVGRAIRDEEGRIFYIVQSDDDAGEPYASMTRKGSEKDEQRYRKLVDGSAKTQQVARENVTQAHDATGKKRSNPVGVLAVLVVLLALAGAAYVYFARPDLVPWLNRNNTPAPAQPGDNNAPATTPGEDPSNATPDAGTPQSSLLNKKHRVIHEGGLSHWGELDAPAWQAGTVSVSIPVVCWDWVPDSFPPAFAFPPEGETAQASDEEPVALPTWVPVSADRARDDGADEVEDPLAGFRVLASGLRYKPIEQGEGQRAQAGHYVAVRYAAYTMDGMALIDDAEHTFILATGQAIRALDEGLAGVRPGGQRLLFVPRGHSVAGHLPGIDELPEDAYLLDVQLETVRPGVSVITEMPGEGDAAMAGDRLVLDYTATVEGEAEPFDSSRLRGQPLRVTLGAGALIDGLEFGLTGIRPGETRLLTIPPYLAYGDRGAIHGLIPPGAVLSYRVTARAIEPADERE
ncbi:FKBP-type peptidyl-prolyl cis-trans isomerase [Phycisphaeraceae bacterium D3-23]